MDTLISNVTVVTMNPRMDVLFGAYIAIEDGKILPPFVAISGLGESAAWDIMDGREGKQFLQSHTATAITAQLQTQVIWALPGSHPP